MFLDWSRHTVSSDWLLSDVAYSSFWNYFYKCDVLCLRLYQLSQSSFMRHTCIRLCIFNLPISIMMVLRIYILFIIIIIKSELWLTCHCLGLGHETIACAVCLSIFFQLELQLLLFLFVSLPKWQGKLLEISRWSSVRAGNYHISLWSFKIVLLSSFGFVVVTFYVIEDGGSLWPA